MRETKVVTRGGQLCPDCHRVLSYPGSYGSYIAMYCIDCEPDCGRQGEKIDKLSKELTRGTQLAKNLVTHLQSMNAESANIPVVLEGNDYVVRVDPGKTAEPLRPPKASSFSWVAHTHHVGFDLKPVPETDR